MTIRTMKERGIEGEALEDGFNLLQNAWKKAVYVWNYTQGLTISEDTGLFISALSEEPGIQAAYWGGKHLSAEGRMRYALDRMKHVPPPERIATFKTVAVVMLADGSYKHFTGLVHGVILTEPRCALQLNMPYSAIFQPDGSDKVWAEMSVEEENKISHRGKAFVQVREYLAELLRK
jgi:XTP/dITP diphosphohydrolase